MLLETSMLSFHWISNLHKSSVAKVYLQSSSNKQSFLYDINLSNNAEVK